MPSLHQACPRPRPCFSRICGPQAQTRWSTAVSSVPGPRLGTGTQSRDSVHHQTAPKLRPLGFPAKISASYLLGPFLLPYSSPQPPCHRPHHLRPGTPARSCCCLPPKPSINNRSGPTDHSSTEGPASARQDVCPPKKPVAPGWVFWRQGVWGGSMSSH